MKTPNVQAIEDDVLERFEGATAGAWLCRRIAGLSIWSQHSYTEKSYMGNASDIFPVSMSQGDQIAAFVRDQPNVKAVLWRVKNHFDHVHYDTWPTGIGLPPCRGGSLRVMHEDGKIGRTFEVNMLTKEEEAFVRSLKAQFDTATSEGFMDEFRHAQEVGVFSAQTKPADAIFASKLAVFLNRGGDLDD